MTSDTDRVASPLADSGNIKHMSISRVGPEFVRLCRALRSVRGVDDATDAVGAMDAFLGTLTDAFEHREDESWTSDESGKMASILLTLMAESPQYRHEQSHGETRRLLSVVAPVRKTAVGLAKRYFSGVAYRSLQPYIEDEIFPMLDSMDPDLAPDRFMPFRVAHVGNIVERLWSMRLRTTDRLLVGTPTERGLLAQVYDRKYLRFGTSGVRARWNLDFTEHRAKQVVQAICAFLKGDNIPDYVGAERLQGRRIVVGFDSRRHADVVAGWVAEVCLGNGFAVELANRDTPTPALVYYLTEYLAADDVAGLINCTPSHNPPEWQGIKFNPRLGYPAPTNVTDFIAAYTNDLQLLDEGATVASIASARSDGRLNGFDPIVPYTTWIMSSGGADNERIALDFGRIRRFFHDQVVVIDEMHGAGRGYLSRVLGQIGVRHEVIHAERDPELTGLDYANPEEPYINPLKDYVRQTGAALGLGLDTDADRFGVVDRDGVYFRPNQILPLLVRYLGIDRGLTGRVVATQTGSPLIEVLAGKIAMDDSNRPEAGVVPAYIDHPFYKLVVGRKTDRMYVNTFLVPVGVKYIEEVRYMDRSYRRLDPPPHGFRNTLLIGGEESSGLSTRGHVPDKDGVWGDLLILDMLSYYGTVHGLRSVADIWKATTELSGCWPSYGGLEWLGSNTGRADVDAVVEAKEALIDSFLSTSRSDGSVGAREYAGLDVIYLGGTRYDIAELQLRDDKGDDRHYLRVRSSGTEPINRIYVESSDPAIARRLRESTLARLDELCVREVQSATSEWRLAEILAYTSSTDSLRSAVERKLAESNRYSRTGVVEKLKRLRPTLERRSQMTTTAWLSILDSAEIKG